MFQLALSFCNIFLYFNGTFFATSSEASHPLRMLLGSKFDTAVDEAIVTLWAMPEQNRILAKFVLHTLNQRKRDETNLAAWVFVSRLVRTSGGMPNHANK